VFLTRATNRAILPLLWRGPSSPHGIATSPRCRSPLVSNHPTGKPSVAAPQDSHGAGMGSLIQFARRGHRQGSPTAPASHQGGSVGSWPPGTPRRVPHGRWDLPGIALPATLQTASSDSLGLRAGLLASCRCCCYARLSPGDPRLERGDTGQVIDEIPQLTGLPYVLPDKQQSLDARVASKNGTCWIACWPITHGLAVDCL
jgi:hypothetical protein